MLVFVSCALPFFFGFSIAAEASEASESSEENGAGDKSTDSRSVETKDGRAVPLFYKTGPLL